MLVKVSKNIDDECYKKLNHISFWLTDDYSMDTEVVMITR